MHSTDIIGALKEINSLLHVRDKLLSYNVQFLSTFYYYLLAQIKSFTHPGTQTILSHSQQPSLLIHYTNRGRSI